MDGVETRYVLNSSAGLTAGVAGGLSISLGASLPEVIATTTGGASTRYVQVQGQILAEYEAGAWGYVLPDHLGSVRQVVAAAGQVTLAQSYDPFGVLMSQSTNFPVSQPFGYTGEQVDGSTDLLFLRARYYDPATGRFLSKDPNPGNVYQPQTLNPYVYILNNAINDRDPSGEQGENFLDEFLKGVVYQFIDNNYSALGIPEQSRSLLRRGADEVAAKYGDSVAFQLGRLTGSVITIGQAFMEVEGGVSIMGCGAVGGLVTAETGIGAATGVGVVVVGAAVTAHGVVVGVVSAANAGDIAGNIYWMVAEGSKGGSGQPGGLNPRNIRYSQKYYSSTGIRRDTGERYTVEENAELLRNNPDKDLPPIRVFRKEKFMDEWGPLEKYGHRGDPVNLIDGEIYTLDHRRLVAYRMAGRDSIPVRWATLDEIRSDRFKFSTPNGGTSIVPNP